MTSKITEKEFDRALKNLQEDEKIVKVWDNKKLCFFYYSRGEILKGEWVRCPFCTDESCGKCSFGEVLVVYLRDKEWGV